MVARLFVPIILPVASLDNLSPQADASWNPKAGKRDGARESRA